MAIYGRRAVEDAPAHGGAILFLSVPIAGIASILVFLLVVSKIHKRLQTGALARDEKGRGNKMAAQL